MSKFLAEVLVLEVAVKLNRPSYLWADCVIPSFALLKPYANFWTLILLLWRNGHDDKHHSFIRRFDRV